MISRVRGWRRAGNTQAPQYSIPEPSSSYRRPPPISDLYYDIRLRTSWFSLTEYEHSVFLVQAKWVSIPPPYHFQYDGSLMAAPRRLPVYMTPFLTSWHSVSFSRHYRFGNNLRGGASCARAGTAIRPFDGSNPKRTESHGQASRERREQGRDYGKTRL